MFITLAPESLTPQLKALNNLGEVNLPSYPTQILFDLICFLLL